MDQAHSTKRPNDALVDANTLGLDIRIGSKAIETHQLSRDLDLKYLRR